jgi:predicted CXXCH cytochrome family protein
MKLWTINRKTVLVELLIILLCFAGGTIAWAAIPQTGIQCTNCHETGMEKPLLPQYQGNQGCVNCHSSSTSSTTYDLEVGKMEPYTLTVPVVYYTGASEPTSYLAGGNFYWVAIDDGSDPDHPNDNKGHNVFSSNPEDVLTSGAPGISHGSGCSWAASCHFNFDLTNDLGMPGLQGRQGCTKCHMLTDDMDYDEPTGFHHADDTVAPVVGSDLQDPLTDPDFDGFFRFLHGHQSGDNHGVCGIEDADWQASSGPGDHNEYLGFQTSLASAGSFSVTGHTVTSFCSGCHGNFHIQECLPAQQPPCYGDWIRHVSGAVLPNSGEFASYTNFDPAAPVARPDFTGWTGASSTVTPGTDLVNCLSCHRAHGSPYPKMLRWDLNGCKTCHTNK